MTYLCFVFFFLPACHWTSKHQIENESVNKYSFTFAETVVNKLLW